MDNVACDPATNHTIQDCSYQTDSNCGQNEGAGVECHNDEPSSDGKTSLVKGLDFKCYLFQAF